jgi:hypothetical protein
MLMGTRGHLAYYVVYLSLTILPEESAASGIEITEPWPEFWTNNAGYKYRMATPTQ